MRINSLCVVHQNYMHRTVVDWGGVRSFVMPHTNNGVHDYTETIFWLVLYITQTGCTQDRPGIRPGNESIKYV